MELTRRNFLKSVGLGVAGSSLIGPGVGGLDASLAAAEAMVFHQGIGVKRIEERLRYLKDYWASALEKLFGVKILTSFDRKQACGIGTFTVKSMDLNRLSDVLFERHKIYEIIIDLPEGIKAIRITPSIYTTLQELDIFIGATTTYIKNGLPS
jgi:isopenicillin-N epimerase